MSASGKRPRKAGAYLLYDAVLLCAALPLFVWFSFRRFVFGDRSTATLSRLGRVPGFVRDERATLLLHGVSVGEIRAMRSLVSLLNTQRPDIRLVISSATRTGKGEADRLFPHLDRTQFPLDLGFACRRFLKAIQPQAVVLMELEIWPNFLRACDRYGISVAIVNGRITEKSMRGYRRVQRFLPQFDRIAFYGAQNERYANRFRTLPVPDEAVEVTGNLKYDNLDAEPHLREGWSAVNFVGAPPLVLGSTHAPEEMEILTAAFADARFDEVSWVLVPRHPHRAEGLLREIRALTANREVLLRSNYQDGRDLKAGSILIVDSIGELDAFYGIAFAAFVGGSLVDHGGQNILEPAACGTPQVVGPSIGNFAEEVRLIEKEGGLVKANNVVDLLDFFALWLERPKAAKVAGENARETLQDLRGASQATLDALVRIGIIPIRN